jgi:two-component system, chemotaxis family, CheB/CheR fusion protein
VARQQDDVDPGVELVLAHLKQVRAFDFTGYKRATLSRRIEKRMQQVGIEDHAEYVDHLQVHPDEFEHLFNTILINVTSFFRDDDTWSAIGELLAELLDRRADEPVRIWSAGCASGQEAYSVVMLCAERLGSRVIDRIKVYATDVDNAALDQARQAVYSPKEMESVPGELVSKYFDPTPRGHQLKNELRRVVIFGRHDLLQDPPISRVDLLLCRNTLMYFNTDVQLQLVNRLHYSLADDGLLVLGKVETLLGHSAMFRLVEPKQRIFRKIARSTTRSRLLGIAGAADALAYVNDSSDEIVDLAFEHRSTAELLLDRALTLVAANAKARSVFGIGDASLGRPFQDLEISYRPVELRSSIDLARAEGRTVTIGGIERWASGNEPTYWDIDVVPLRGDDQHLGVLLTFIDVSTHRRTQEELEQTHRELESAYEELQSANEELETTNEELQSTVEELETTNEELQSTNEELETMNEELSSTNEELQAINDELRDRTSELNQVNAYMESILTTLEASVIVVDRKMDVRVWNGLSYEMWGLRPDEVEGRPFLTLDIGFPVERLGGPLRAAMNGGQHTESLRAEATSRRGHRIECTAKVAPLAGADGQVEGAIVIIEELSRRA